MLEPLARKDQRRWGGVYLRGLMLDGKRKSIEPMAGRLDDGDEQCLQQFVNQSPWRWEPVRERLALQMSATIGPAAWVIDDTGFPKFGRMSVGVARQCCGALGKIANCQIGVSISAVSAQASCPIDWRLYLPAEWDEDPRRTTCRVPEAVRHQPKWQLALAMIDELRGWGIDPPPVLADAAYGNITELRLGLQAREIDYVCDVKGSTSALAEDARPERPARSGGPGRPPLARYRGPFDSLADLARAAGPEAYVEVVWREGTRGPLASRFVALRVRPANLTLRRAAAAGELPVRWLLAEWPAGTDAPSAFWLSMAPDTPIEALVALAKLRWRVEQDYRELKDALGLDHFEGRSWGGWHHHVTLVSVAHGFLTTERLGRPQRRAAA